MIVGDELAEAIEQARADYYLPMLDDETPVEHDGDGRFVLLERGHYGTTWVTFHDTPEDAASYSLGQEYSEDWAPEVILDRLTGKTLTPKTIVWE